MFRLRKVTFVGVLLIFIFSFTLAGCGGGGGGSSSSGTTVEGTAQLGNLANATVKIYKISDNGTADLKWIETTSNGTTLDEIGKFNTHSGELDPDNYYLYEVIGGEDWDANDDGIKDDNATPNKGVIRAIAKGSDIQYAGSNFRVTFASEAVYEQVAKYLKYDFNPANFATELKKAAQSVLGDVNNDGVVNVEDMLAFNPAVNKNKLKGIYRYEMNNITDNIHGGKNVYTNLSPTIGELTIINNYSSSDNAISITLFPDENYAFLSTSERGLKIINIADPQNMEVIKTLDDNDSIEGVLFSPDGSKAYVADENKGLQILDTGSLSITTTIDNTTGINYVATDPRGRYVYITNYDNVTKRYYFKVIDTNNKTVIKNYNDNKTSVYSGISVYHDSSSNTTYAYVVGYNGTHSNYGLWIFDVTNPGNITVKNFITDYDDSEPWSVSISPDGKYAYVGCNCGLEIFNVSNPDNASLIAYLPLPEFNYARGITISKDGKYVYVTNCNTSNVNDRKGIEIIDVSNPYDPKPVGRIATHSTAFGVTLSKNGNYLYIATHKGIEVVDLSVATSVTSSNVVGSVSLKNWAMNAAISKDGKYAYVADYKNGLQVVDVSKPYAPNVVGSISSPNEYAYGVGVSPDGKSAYVANYSNDFWVVDVSKPDNPEIVDNISLGTTGSAQGEVISQDGKYAYVADGSAGLKIVSLDNLSVNTVSFSDGNAYGVAVSGKYAYVADGSAGLKIVNLDNTSEIVGCSIAGVSKNVVLSSNGEYAYVATNNGLTIVNVYDPGNPKVVDNIPMPGEANSVTISPDGRYLYVSDGVGGLQIVGLRLLK